MHELGSCEIQVSENKTHIPLEECLPIFSGKFQGKIGLDSEKVNSSPSETHCWQECGISKRSW